MVFSQQVNIVFEESSFPPPSRKEKELTLTAPLLQSFQTLTLNINDMTPVQLYLSNIENLFIDFNQ